MNELVNKIESYNIFNFLAPGVLIAFVVEQFTSFKLSPDNLFISFFVYYFMGLIVSRVGSLLVEPILKFTKFVKFAEYRDYIQASSSDSKIELLSQENNMYRTYIAMLIIALAAMASSRMQISHSLNTIVIYALILALLLMLFAYRKQTNYIKRRVESVKDKK